MPLYTPPTSGGGLSGMPAGPYTAGYSASNRTLPPYTADPKSTAFVGGLLDLLQAARLNDLNATRLALENLRVFVEGTAQQHNALVADLKAMGILS